MFYYYGFARNILNCRRAYSCSEKINIVFFLRNILYAAPVSTAPKCEVTNLLHIILYFVVDALCIQSILVDKLHCRS